MKNPINISGKEFESLTTEILESSGHSFKKTKRIDYEIKLDNKIIGLEVKAQKQGGTTDEKLMYSIYKYSKKYKEIVFLLHPLFKFRKGIRESMEFVAEYQNVKLSFIWGTENLNNYLKGKVINHTSNISRFC
tara:strand:- start:621 stop:1019 length:399 start_codon:yes stop_codon:yes gene_type:complete